MPSGNARRVEMADVVGVDGDVVDEVALHELHVIAVEQQLDVGAVNGLHDLKALVGGVEIIALVVIHGVERLQHDGDAGLFGNFRRALEVFDQQDLLRVFKAALQIAAQTDERLAAEFAADGDGLFHIFLDGLPREVHTDRPRLV